MRRIEQAFDENVYFGALIRGDLRHAMGYLERFPECGELRERYTALFEGERPALPGLNPSLDGILSIYQRYYTDVFYRLLGRDESAGLLRNRLADFLRLTGPVGIGEMERGPISEAFAREGLHFLGGKTGGYFGPFVWRDTETATYNVELPDGIEPYTVKLLDGFISKSWLDHISFGRLSIGGWTDSEGVICCDRSSYDLDSENFRVSLLKHEAQHARDLREYGPLPSGDLEYRAKLVELIYSGERELLPLFIREAGGPEDGGHGAAAQRIVNGYTQKLGLSAEELERLPLSQIQRTAKELFAEDRPGG